MAMPADVADRLDDVLAELVEERSTTPAEVVPLRRRRWPAVLVAAAAVSVIGYAGVNLVRADREADTASSAADSGGSTDERAAPEAAAGDQGAGRDGALREDAAPSVPTATNLPGKASGRAAYLLRDQTWSSAAKAIDGSLLGRHLLTYNGRGCPGPALRAGETSYVVRLGEGRRGVIVVQPLSGSAARAELYPCGQPSFPVAYELVLGAR
jgi:hypothetical protein